jgi:hypothetical protein
VHSIHRLARINHANPGQDAGSEPALRPPGRAWPAGRQGQHLGPGAGPVAGEVDAAGKAERSFALAKHWRALANRYDKLAITYRGAVVLSAYITWTRG